MPFGFTGAALPQQTPQLSPQQAIMQAMAPQIPMYQGGLGGGGGMRMMMPGIPVPRQPQQQGNSMGQTMGGLMNPQMIAMLKKQFAPSAGGIPGGSGSLANYLTGGTGSLTGGDVNALTQMFGPGMGAGVSPY